MTDFYKPAFLTFLAISAGLGLLRFFVLLFHLEGLHPIIPAHIMTGITVAALVLLAHQILKRILSIDAYLKYFYHFNLVLLGIAACMFSLSVLLVPPILDGSLALDALLVSGMAMGYFSMAIVFFLMI